MLLEYLPSTFFACSFTVSKDFVNLTHAYVCVCVHGSFAFRHREARADLLVEFQLHLQVLQWGPGVERGRGGGGDLQHCHHTQQLPQNQTPRIIEDNEKWRGTRGVGGKGSEGAMQKERLTVPSIFSLCNLPPSFSSLRSLSVISLFQPSLVFAHTYPCCWQRQEYGVTVYT